MIVLLSIWFLCVFSLYIIGYDYFSNFISIRHSEIYDRHTDTTVLNPLISPEAEVGQFHTKSDDLQKIKLAQKEDLFEKNILQSAFHCLS